MDIDSRDERMFVYDPRENEWSELSQLVRWPDDASAGDVIEGAAVVASESAGKLFVVGGLETAFSDSRRRVDAYDPATDEWSRLPDQPRPADGAENTRVVMLRPGSTTWVDLPVPEAVKDVGTRISAVHIG